jgi:hypothetical protein
MGGSNNFNIIKNIKSCLGYYCAWNFKGHIDNKGFGFKLYIFQWFQHVDQIVFHILKYL